MLCMVPSWLSPVCSELLSSVGPMPWFSDEHFSLAHEYASCVIIETSWVQPTGEEQRASRMPVELCLCFQEIDLRALMRLALRIVNYVGRRLRRQIPSLWEMRPKQRPAFHYRSIALAVGPPWLGGNYPHKVAQFVSVIGHNAPPVQPLRG